jgi:hypothetical protein
MNSTGIKLAVGAPWPFALYKQNKNQEKKKEKGDRKYSIKIYKSKEEKIECHRNSYHKIAPVDINETLWNDEANIFITCM